MRHVRSPATSTDMWKGRDGHGSPRCRVQGAGSTVWALQNNFQRLFTENQGLNCLICAIFARLRHTTDNWNGRDGHGSPRCREREFFITYNLLVRIHLIV